MYPISSLKDMLKSSPKDKTALIYDDKEYSYDHLHQAAKMWGKNCVMYATPGDRILIESGNTALTVIYFFGCLSRGFVPVIINPTLKAHKKQLIIEDCKPAYIVGDFYQEMIKENLGTKVTDKNPSLVLYTSGSLGEQKGVICEEHSMIAAIKSINTYLHNSERDIIFNTLPLHHSYGLYQMLTMFSVGGTIVLENGFTFPMKLLEKIKKYKATVVPLVFTSVATMLKVKPETIKDCMKTVKYITTAGANMPEKYRNILSEMSIPVIVMYGQTECVRITYRPTDDNHPGSTGITIPGQTTEIIDEDGTVLPPGTIGELVVKGPHIMSGYLNKEDLSAGTFSGGYLYTGDMFYKDEDGHHYFVSRRDDLIKIKGEKVSPIEIEAIVNQMPNMEAAIATVVPDEMNGHAIVLHVIIDNASTRDIMFYCKKNLEKELMPKKIVFWDEFPLVEGSNKIDRVALKQHGLKEIGL